MNKRRLRLVIAAIVTAAAVAYTAFNYVPAYGAFAEDVRERWLWKARGFDDPEVRRKAYENCMGDMKAGQSAPSSPSEMWQFDSLCSRPGWIPGEPMPSWWDTTVAYLKSVGASRVTYVLGAIFVAPWLFAFLMVSAVPATGAGIWRWLKTPDDSDARPQK